MMSQTNPPIYSYENDKNPVIDYKFKINEYENERFGDFYLGSKRSYDNSDPISSSSKCNLILGVSESEFPQSLGNPNYFNYFNATNLAVQPNFEKPGGPNTPTNKKIFLSNPEYNLLNKHVKYSDQHIG